jgi:hypothetical protein
MAILTGDIKLLKSSVMADVPEGGGAPTGITIADGASNAIFPDISELDRAGGRVNLRKTFVAVQTDDVDTYFGGNVIVAEPPADPRVSVTLFTNRSTFDNRTEAAARVESYLNKGPLWGGFLYENHITGQRSVQLFQRPEAELPAIGQTLVLIPREGFPDQQEQYVRSTAVESVTRQFFDPDSGKDFPAAVVTISISDALRFDLPGSPASRTFTPLATATRVRDTVVADAGTYVGVVPLVRAAVIGDFTVGARDIFTQLVPSAQTESPITDVRTNGLSAALVATGTPITRVISMGFTTTTAMHVGGPILPGTLSITAASVTATDKGGLLVNGAAEVGQVDYDNGIVRLSVNLWGAGGNTFTVTFTPAAVPELVSNSYSLPVTAESRSLNYTRVFEEIPLPRTMSVSYLAQGRWYVLRDNGSGVLAGNSSGVGVGTLNYTTGAMQVTLGALPDVGSSILVQSYSEATTVRASNTFLQNGGKAFFPINSAGDMTTAKGPKPFARNSLSITWPDGAGTKTATDNGAGALTGDATGTVIYGDGVVLVSPNTLPPPGTVFSVASSQRGVITDAGVVLAGGMLGSGSVSPGSVSFTALTQLRYTLGGGFRLAFSTRDAVVSVVDDGAGNLLGSGLGPNTLLVGSINYATGQINFTGFGAFDGAGDPAGPTVSFVGYQGNWMPVTITRAWAYMRGSGTGVTFTTATSANITYSTAPGAGAVADVAVSQYLVQTMGVPAYTLRGVSFELGSSRYGSLTDGTLLIDVSPTTGGGSPAGSVAGALGLVSVSAWPANAPPTVQNWRGLIAPPSVGPSAPFAALSTVFRTASSPLRPGSLSVLGALQDGTTFNITADSSGKIDGARVKGRVDYQFGLVELYFVNPAGDPAFNTDLSFLQIPGLTSAPADLGMLGTLRYNAVAFSYLPLDAELLGIDPVRLPSDGRVPIFRPGGFAVVGHTGQVTGTVINGQVVNCNRVRLSRVRVIGFNGAVINTGFTTDLELGTVTFTNVAGYSQPVTVQHRIEDMGVVRDVQISGEVTFTRAVTHNYPLGSYLSSALIAGDLFARTSVVFDQATWTGVFSDAPIGNSATATYNNAQYPIAVTNRGAIAERWALRFTNTNAFEVIGENVGVIATGNTATLLSPINPATGAPYFTLNPLGWGAGWAAGNVLRINTVGAQFPVWVVRTVQQGPETVTDDKFTLLIRGDVDTP